MIRTEQQRAAMFARMKTPGRRFAFPMRGEGGRARRNRGTAAAAVVGVGSLLLLKGASSKTRGLSTLLRANRSINPKTASWAFAYKSAPEGAERYLSKVPVIGPALFGGKAMKNMVNIKGIKEWRQNITNVPPLARAEVNFRRAVKNRLANMVDRASLWKTFGSGDATLKAIGDAGYLLKSRVGGATRKVRNRLITPRVFNVKTFKAPTNDPDPTITNTFKVALKRPKRIASPVERFIDRPFRSIRNNVKYLDVQGTRKLRSWIRRQRRQTPPLN